MSRIVDIIVPVYNAYEDLVRCVDSVYKYTDLKNNRLVLINDNSSDKRIKTYLDQQISDNVIIIHNEVNKGFSANVNLGIQQSDDNDVLLLNSDTVVTKNWLDKIMRCAYSSAGIGTVTPLSNNATLCSVPAFCEENELPENLSVDDAAEIVERVSLKKYPRITVAHGFCMLIKRCVIRDIGLFDAETFERGYGEENDFCNRAEQAGYYHVMCDDTYILHTGTKSFANDEKAKYIREHDDILRNRYPVQMHNNDVHVRDNPNGSVGQNLRVYMDLSNGRKNILYILHTDFREDVQGNKGGTELHVKHLKDLMKKEYNVFVAARNSEFLDLTCYIDDKRYIWKFYVGEQSQWYSFFDQQIEKVWRNVLPAFNISAVHIHHLRSTSYDIFRVASDYNIPIIYTLHDFFMVTPSVTLTDDKYQIVTYENEKEDSWDGYLKDHGVYDCRNYIRIWREHALWALKKCDRIIVPDDSLKKMINEYYRDALLDIEVIEHGYDFMEYNPEKINYDETIECSVKCIRKEGSSIMIFGRVYSDIFGDGDKSRVYLELCVAGNKDCLVPASIINGNNLPELTHRCYVDFEALIPAQYGGRKNLSFRIIIVRDDKYRVGSIKQTRIPGFKANNSKRLNVAFIGGISATKGGKQILNLVKQNVTGVNWFLFGKAGYDALKDYCSDNYNRVGEYDSNDLPILLNIHEIDYVCILSVFPETYSYTLTEARLCGKPVIVTDIGSLGNRVKPFCPECCVDIENIEEQVLSIIDNTMKNPEMISVYLEQQDRIKIKSLSHMKDDYSKLYQSVMRGTHYDTGTPDYNYLYSALEKDQQNDNDPENYDYIRTKDIIEKYNIIVNSGSYKLARRLSSISFPGGKRVKSLLRKVMKS